MSTVGKWISCFLFATAIMVITAGTSYALDADAALPDNGLPVVIIEIEETEGHTIEDMNDSPDHSVDCYGTMQITVPEEFRCCDLDIDANSLGPVELEYIRGRGNSTWSCMKKPYRIKLKKKADVFGLGLNKHWVLLANAFDETAFKNRWIGWLGDELGFEFTPRGVPVDVVMIGKVNGKETSRVNLGNYLFAEHLRIDENRLNIPELTPDDTDEEDITGGYLIQNGNQVSDNSPDIFFTEREFCLANHTPTFDPTDSDYTNEAQKKYIRDRIQDMENAIYGEGVDDDEGDIFTNTKGIRYNEYMDMESAAKYWLIQELTGNGDAYVTGSTYFYKKPDTFDESGQRTAMGMFYWGPLWDFDIAMETENPENNVEDFSIPLNWIMAMLYDDDPNGFRETVKRVWPEIKDKTLASVDEGGLIDQYCDEMEASYAADYEIWKDLLDDRYLPRADHAAVVSILKQWTKNRINWMDSHILGSEDDGIPNLDHMSCKISYVADGRVVRRDYRRIRSYLNLCYPGYEDAGYAPEKEGCVFTGWLQEDGSSAGRGIVITKDTTLTAHFVDEDQARHAEKLRFRMDEEWCNFDNTRIFDSKYTVIPPDAQEKNITWSSSDENIATVDNKGRVTLFGPGTVLITGALRNGTETSYELTVTSGQQPDMEDMKIVPEEITLKVGEHEHIGATILPKLSLVDDVWFSSEDFEIASVDGNGVVKGGTVGSTRIKVEAEYYDEETDRDNKVVKYCTITVVPASEPDSQPVSIEGAKVILSKPAFTFNGRVQKPSVRTVGGKTLKVNTDYTVKWSNPSSKNVGVYTAVITGKGNYTGTATASYRINPAGTGIKTLKKARKAITVKWKKQSAGMTSSRITGYQIQLATDSKFTRNKKTVTVKGYKNVSKKITKLRAKKKYYVRIRTNMKVRGGKCYSSWSKAKSVKTR